MRNIILYLTLSITVLPMNYAIAIDKQSCEVLKYGPAGVASDQRSLVPTKTVAPKYKFCSGTMVVGSSEAIGSNKMFHVSVSGTGDDIVCQKITTIISSDKADQKYLKSHNQLEFHACLKPRDALRLTAADASVGIGDINKSATTRAEKTWLIVKLYGFNQALERIIHRNRINQIFMNEDDKDDKGNTLVFPADDEICSMDIINNLAGYQDFRADEFEKSHSGTNPIKCGEFLDGTYMRNPISLPHYKDKFHKNNLRADPENELLQAIMGQYASRVDQYPNFNSTGFGKLKETFTWKEFLDKALDSPFSDKLEVGDGHGFKS